MAFIRGVRGGKARSVKKLEMFAYIQPFENVTFLSTEIDELAEALLEKYTYEKTPF